MTPDETKEREQLKNELVDLRRRVSELAVSDIKRWRAEQKLQKSEQMYTTISDAAKDGIILIDSKANIVSWNKAAQTTFGYTEDEILNKHLTVLMPEQFRTAFQKGMEQLNSEDMPLPSGTTHEFSGLRKDGSQFTADISLGGWKQGEEAFYVGIVRDITESKEAEEELRLKAQLLDSTGDSISLLDADGNIVYANKKFCRSHGYSSEELIGMKIEQVDHQLLGKLLESRIKELTEKGVAVFESSHTRKDGSTFPVEIHSRVIWSGNSIFTLSVERDITERKRAEEALRESEERYRAIFEQAADSVVLIDTENGALVKFNNKAHESLGYSREEFAKLKLSDIEAIESTEEVKRHIEKVVEEGSDVFETRHRTKGGEIRDIQVSARAIYIGGRDFILTIWRDITESRQAEELYRTLAESSPVGVYIFQDGKFCFVNSQFRKLTGFSEDELLNMNPWELVNPEDRVRARENAIQMLKGNRLSPYEFRVTNKAGEIKWSMETVASIYYNGKRATLANFMDITEHKRMEEALQESEERYRALMNLGGSVGEAIIMLQDKDGVDAVQVFVSDEWPRITGYSRKELLGMSFFDLLHSEDREASLTRHKRKMSGEIIPGLFEMATIRKDGTEVPIEITSAYTIYKGERANVVFIRDITERKQAQEREKELQQELNICNRFASIGELAAGVAHEINNPLTGIMGFSERLLRKSTDEEISQDLERIHSEAQRAARVVENLRTFARRREPKKEYLDINEILGRTLELRDYELRIDNIELVVELTPYIPKIIGDFGQIQQVFLNIILNAEQAMTEANGGGKLTIKTQKIKDHIRISFADDGPGILAENLDRVFDPFFTTRGERDGTGLGLSACHGIVTEHGGRIYAKSKPGKGATFFVELKETAKERGK